MGLKETIHCDCCKRGPLRAFVKLDSGMIRRFTGRLMSGGNLVGGSRDREFLDPLYFCDFVCAANYWERTDREGVGADLHPLNKSLHDSVIDSYGNFKEETS